MEPAASRDRDTSASLLHTHTTLTTRHTSKQTLPCLLHRNARHLPARATLRLQDLATHLPRLLRPSSLKRAKKGQKSTLASGKTTSQVARAGESQTAAAMPHKTPRKGRENKDFADVGLPEHPPLERTVRDFTSHSMLRALRERLRQSLSLFLRAPLPLSRHPRVILGDAPNTRNTPSDSA